MWASDLRVPAGYNSIAWRTEIFFDHFNKLIGRHGTGQHFPVNRALFPVVSANDECRGTLNTEFNALIKIIIDALPVFPGRQTFLERFQVSDPRPLGGLHDLIVLSQPFRIFINGGLILPKAILVAGTFHRFGKNPGFLVKGKVTVAKLNPIHIALPQAVESALNLFAKRA